MSDVPVRVTVRNGTVTIQFPAKLLNPRRITRRSRTIKEDLRQFKAVEGMWKHRKPDGLAYQRRVRREWAHAW